MTWTVRVPNWREFQNYAHRRPPWIKLHRMLLEKPAWRRLSGSAAKLLVDVWMLAAGSKNGEITMTLPDLAYSVRLPEADVLADLQVLAAHQFLELGDTLQAAASAVQAPATEWVPEQRRGETEQSRDKSKTVADATAKEENVYRTIMPLIREHLWKPDGVCPVEIKGKPWSEGQEGTVVRELHKTYSVSDIETAVLGLGAMLRGLAEDERPEWLPLGAKCSLRAVYHTRSGVVQMVEKCKRAYWSIANKRPKGPRTAEPSAITIEDVA